MKTIVVAGTETAARFAIAEMDARTCDCIIVTPSTDQNRLRGISGCTLVRAHGAERVPVELWSFILRGW